MMRALFMAFAVVMSLSLILFACSSSSRSDEELCQDVVEAYCKKSVECGSGGLIFGVTDASQCAAVAVSECKDDEGEDGDDSSQNCSVPAESTIDACIAQMGQTECSEFANLVNVEGPCKQAYDAIACDEEDLDGDSTTTDGDNTTTDGDNATTDGDSTTTDGDNVTTDGDLPTVNTAACVAAINSSCDVGDACVQKFPNLPAKVTGFVDNCDTTLASKQAEIESACQDYLQTGLQAGDPLAANLNSASAAVVEACAGDISCDLTFASDLADAYTNYTTSNSSTDMAALLALLLAECF